MSPLMGDASAKGPPGVAHSPRPSRRRIACSCNILTRVSVNLDPARLWPSPGGRVDENDSRREDQWFRENEKVLLENARIAREKRERERAALEAEADRDAR